MAEGSALQPRRLEHSEEFARIFCPSYASCPYPEVHLVPALTPLCGGETSCKDIQVIHVIHFLLLSQV